ncbi:MAG: putative glycosyltransferase [Phenylobacterium sp.]|jgi:putative glycosyltransferase
MKLSIVTTLYQSDRYIQDFYQRITETAKLLTDSYELVFVDDGSPDNSLESAVEISQRDDKVKVVELSKNHGHHRAMMVGFAATQGELVFLIDCDLEEAPENLALFWKKIHSDQSIDVVYGVQPTDSEAVSIKSRFSKIFYKAFNFFSFAKIPENELISRLMKRNYIKALLRYNESELFIPGIWVDVGFKRITLPVEKISDGFSTYSTKRKILMAVNAITAFSTKPLIYIFYLGTISSLISVGIVLYLIANKFIFGVDSEGWTSIVASIYLMGSLIIFSMGIIGIYLSRVFSEVKRRPTSIIKNIYCGGNTLES